ncbi:MAG: hypothetical protein K0U64_10970 [Actinomycetia bacterium]|nr:hypothetical protein [Actinomycetes bacterium]
MKTSAGLNAAFPSAHLPDPTGPSMAGTRAPQASAATRPLGVEPTAAARVRDSAGGVWNESAITLQQRQFALLLAVTGTTLPAPTGALKVAGVCSAIGGADQLEVVMVVGAVSERTAVQAGEAALRGALEPSCHVQALTVIDYDREVLEVLEAADIRIDGALADFDEDWAIAAVLDRARPIGPR